MKGTILSYRRGKHTQNVNQMLLEIEGISDRKNAESLIGKKVLWKTPGNREIAGEIIGVHGNKGLVRAKFNSNLPGQSIATKVDILD